jgi:endonuclease/exonuclease/phosphatase family metal-dependent hydrolase
MEFLTSRASAANSALGDSQKFRRHRQPTLCPDLFCRSVCLIILLCVATSALRASESLRVITVNVASRDNLKPLAQELRQKELNDADIYLLQEVIGEARDASNTITALLPGREMHTVFHGATELAAGKLDGLAILSRFPLRDVQVIALPQYNFLFRSRQRFALAAIAETPLGDVMVVNTHLDTRINLQSRLRQLEPIIRLLETSDLPAILAGDLNTNPHRWLFHQIPIPFTHIQSLGLERHLDERGFQSVIQDSKPTHDLLSMRLDWIFVRQLTPSTANVQPLKHSDHHAIVTTLVKANLVKATGD